MERHDPPREHARPLGRAPPGRFQGGWTGASATKTTPTTRPSRSGAAAQAEKSGEKITLDAAASDPDGDRLSFQWIHYPEPGTNRGADTPLAGGGTPKVSFVARVTQPETLHLLLILTDAGDPPLTRYRRVVLTVHP